MTQLPLIRFPKQSDILRHLLDDTDTERIDAVLGRGYEKQLRGIVLSPSRRLGVIVRAEAERRLTLLYGYNDRQLKQLRSRTAVPHGKKRRSM